MRMLALASIQALSVLEMEIRICHDCNCIHRPGIEATSIVYLSVQQALDRFFLSPGGRNRVLADVGYVIVFFCKTHCADVPRPDALHAQI